MDHGHAPVGAGLLLMEGIRLRVKDIDFAHNQIVVRDGKGQKDRVTMPPYASTSGIVKICRSDISSVHRGLGITV